MRSTLLSALLLILASGAPMAGGTVGAGYRVKQGDTAARIAKLHGLSVAELQAINPGVKLARLSIGQTILGGIFGRKLGSATSVNRAASTIKSAGRTARQRGDVDAATAALATAPDFAASRTDLASVKNSVV